MSNRQTCLFSLVALCLGTVSCEELYVERGKTVTMRCVRGSSHIILWKHNSQLLLKVDGKSGRTLKGSLPMVGRAKMSGSNLLLSGLVSADAGHYTCEGENTGITEHYVVYVVSVSTRPAHPLLLGTKAEFQCHISAESSAQPQWLRPDGAPVKGSQKGTFTLQSVGADHSGNWACQLNPKSKIILPITVLGLSSTPNLTVSQGDSALLPCIPSLDLTSRDMDSLRPQAWGWVRLSPVSAHLLSVVKKDGKFVLNNTGVLANSLLLDQEKLNSNFSLTLKKVTVQHSGQYQCFLKFQDKRTMTAEVLLEVIGQLGEMDYGPGTNGIQFKSKDGLLGLSLWVWLTIGAACLVLIFLIGITVYLSQRNKRMKKRARKLRSMRQPLTARDYCQCNNRNTVGRPNGRRRDAPSVKECQR